MSVESALLAAFAMHLGPVQVISYSATPWFSATFSGARHVFSIETDASPEIEAFTRTIGEADITIPRGFVADIAVSQAPGDDAQRLTIEALTIDA